MSNVFSFKRQLAVAAAAVAGVLGLAGTTWAAPAATGVIDKMTATYTNNQITELQATGKNLTEENLRIDVEAQPTVGNLATQFGNLGTIRVKTNSKHWDVHMTTDNGGKMLDKTSMECKMEDEVDGWGNKTGNKVENCTGTSPKYLMYDKVTSAPGNPVETASTPVTLDVAIGIAKSGKALGNTGAPATLYPMTSAVANTGPTFIKPVKLDADKIEKSEKSLKGSSDYAEVSFAKTFGSATKTRWDMFVTGIYGKNNVPDVNLPDEAKWSNIENDGFPIPKYNNETNEEYFYVNVGMLPTVFDSVGGNENKKSYTETFYFELWASF